MGYPKNLKSVFIISRQIKPNDEFFTLIFIKKSI